MPAPGLPDSTRVDELNDTPDGSFPDSVTEGVGCPVTVTVNVPLAPTENVAELAEVIAGAIGFALVLAVMLTPFA